MDTEIIPTEKEGKEVNVKVQSGSGGAVYGLGMIGAWVYFISRATTFQEGMVGFLKGIVWPALLVYRLLEFFEKEPPTDSSN